jgi:hypothetical protein
MLPRMMRQHDISPVPKEQTIMVALLIGSAFVIGLGLVTDRTLSPLSKEWASWKEQQAFERQREEWRNAWRPF